MSEKGVSLSVEDTCIDAIPLNFDFLADPDAGILYMKCKTSGLSVSWWDTFRARSRVEAASSPQVFTLALIGANCLWHPGTSKYIYRPGNLCPAFSLKILQVRISNDLTDEACRFNL